MQDVLFLCGRVFLSRLLFSPFAGPEYIVRLHFSVVATRELSVVYRDNSRPKPSVVAQCGSALGGD